MAETCCDAGHLEPVGRATMNTSEIVEFIESVTTRPSMYVNTSSEPYYCIAAFLRGCNVALGGSVFEGLNEWLCMKYDKSYSVGWEEIVAIETLGETDYDRKPWSDETQTALLSALRETLTDYVRHRGTVGLRNVLYDHGVWMRSRSSFNENVERYGSSSGLRDA